MYIMELNFPGPTLCLGALQALLRGLLGCAPSACARNYLTVPAAEDLLCNVCQFLWL